MKKIISLLLSLLMLASLAACGADNTGTDTTPQKGTPAVEENQASTSSPDGIDVDLTAMSSTMVFSEVQNMMMSPNDYIGKTVKMAGTFNVAETEDNIYFACIIKDATACCAQGIEFDWEGDHAYPDDYPEQGADITVIGSFTTYKENTQTYCQLANADVQF